MVTVAKEDSNGNGKIEEKISRANFLKMLGISSGLVLGIGGLSSIDKLLLDRKALAVHQPATPQQPFTYIIYKRGSETVAQKSDGSNPVHDTITENPIRTALEDSGPLDNPMGIRAGPGHIQILDGIYDLSPSFGGFHLRSFTTLILGPQTVLRVPNGYAGEVFILESTPSMPATPTTPPSPAKPLSDCTIDGGDIRERGPSPQRLWTGILLHGIEEGVLFNKLRNTTIRSAKIGIQLKATSDPNAPADRLGIDGGWVNGNLFEGLKMWDNEIFIDFLMENAYKPDTQVTGIHRNRFINIECQTDSNTQHGVRNIRHFGNSFINVNVWDIGKGAPGAIISSIHPDARGTIIISGIMTGQGFSDQGIATKIFDENNGPFL